MAGVPYTFGNATTAIPLSQLDANFNTTATLGNAAIGLGNVTTTVGNLTLQNVTITSYASSPPVTLSNISNGNSNVTIASSNGNISLVAAGTENARLDTNGNFQFNSGYGSLAIAYGVRAWVNFSGATSPGTIRSSGNVSSVTKNGTGDYTVNFVTTFPDANYSVCGSSVTAGSSNLVIVKVNGAITNTSARILNVNASNIAVDSTYVDVIIFR